MKKIAELTKIYLIMAADAGPTYNEYYDAWTNLLNAGYPDFSNFVDKYHMFLVKSTDEIKKLIKEAIEYDESQGGESSHYGIYLRKVITKAQEKSPQLLSQIKQILVNYCLENSRLFHYSQLIKFEDIFSKSELQNFIVQYIKQYMSNPDDPHLNTKITNFLTKFLNSKIIHPEVIARLLRQVNPERFSRYYEGGPDWAAGDRGHHSDDDRWLFHKHFFEKEKYTIDDIIWFIQLMQNPTSYSNRNYGVDYRRLRHVVDHATPAAQNLLRRALFRISKNNYFIFDESMQPLGLEYKHINVQNNEHVSIVYGILTKEMSAKWAQIFEDFKIIPLEGTLDMSKSP